MEMESVSVTHVTFMPSSSLYAHSHILFVFFLRFPPNAALVIDATRAPPPPRFMTVPTSDLVRVLGRAF